MRLGRSSIDKATREKALREEIMSWFDTMTLDASDALFQAHVAHARAHPCFHTDYMQYVSQTWFDGGYIEEEWIFGDPEGDMVEDLISWYLFATSDKHVADVPRLIDEQIAKAPTSLEDTVFVWFRCFMVSWLRLLSLGL